MLFYYCLSSLSISNYCFEHCLNTVLNNSEAITCGEFAKVVSFLHHRVRADLSDTSQHWVWTIWLCGPLNFATTGKRHYFLSFATFFASLREALYAVKTTSKSSQVAKSITLMCLVLLPLLRLHLRGVGAVWGCDGAVVRPARQIRGGWDDTGGRQSLASLSVQALTRRWARYRATFPQHTFDGTRVQRHLAHQFLKPLCVCLTARASVVNGVSRFWVLRACESWSIANPERVKKQ